MAKDWSESVKPRVIAIDWSGALDGAAKKIWLAEVDPTASEVLRLESGRDRNQIARHIVDLARANPNLVVGFDFAFSLPDWFLVERKLADAPSLWSLAASEGEKWLAECKPPFWGRPQTRRPALDEHLRRTDREVPAVGGLRPKSVFQIGGAGAVGTGSIRGMPMLQLLREAGFSVWPFDPVSFPLIVEIYPRLLTGPVIKTNSDARIQYLNTRYPALSDDVRRLAASSEDAFDALVAALVMAVHADEFAKLPGAEDSVRLREGRIWHPSTLPVEGIPRKLRDSSKTRVAPLFEELKRRDSGGSWIPRVLEAASEESRTVRGWKTEDLSLVDSYWWPTERCLQPPISLLSWLIRNFDPPERALEGDGSIADNRRRLQQRDPIAIEEALGLLRSGGTRKSWHLLEGPTCPDAFITTPDALIVVEGKRTEPGSTVDTTFMSGRHQMLRHLDAAWEIRGKRSVYGVLIVEAADESGTIPVKWREAASGIRTPSIVQTSLPHRSAMEQFAIAQAFVGVTTWQALCRQFELPLTILPDTTQQMPRREIIPSNDSELNGRQSSFKHER